MSHLTGETVYCTLKRQSWWLAQMLPHHSHCLRHTFPPYSFYSSFISFFKIDVPTIWPLDLFKSCRHCKIYQFISIILFILYHTALNNSKTILVSVHKELNIMIALTWFSICIFTYTLSLAQMEKKLNSINCLEHSMYKK